MKLLQSRIVFVLAGLGLLWLAGMILFGKNGYLDYLDMEDRLVRIESENQVVAEENARLRRLATRLKNDSDYIEHVARKELGMVGKDELIYRYKPEVKQPEGKQPDER